MAIPDHCVNFGSFLVQSMLLMYFHIAPMAMIQEMGSLRE